MFFHINFQHFHSEKLQFNELLILIIIHNYRNHPFTLIFSTSLLSLALVLYNPNTFIKC
jgi:hypothetical protein